MPLRLPRCVTNRSRFYGSSRTFTVTCPVPETPGAFLTWSEWRLEMEQALQVRTRLPAPAAVPIG